MSATPSPETAFRQAMAQARGRIDDDPAAAARFARAALRIGGRHAGALRLLGRALRALGEDADAERAELDAITASVGDPRLIEAAAALAANELPVAERLLRAHLRDDPFDVAAIRMMAELAGRIGRYRDAEVLLRRALELAPAFGAARANLATVLHRQNRPTEALAELDALLARDPENVSHANLKAAALGRIGDYDEAIALYEAVLAQVPDQPKVWMSYGHVLKTVGCRDDCIAAYRRAIAIRPALGEVWWSLANLKTLRFTPADVAAMRRARGGSGLSVEDRFHLDFALGKALEDAGDAEGSFAHYAAANALRRSQIDYDPDDTARQVARAKAVFSRDFFAARAGQGCPAPDPIFILGMPRAGSTLIEQILASHPLVEGTMELPDIPALAARTGAEGGRYPEGIATLSAERIARLGEEYLERTRIQRKTDKPFFIDKLPNNWLHAGFIHLILPNAKIIDARRHPLGSCFSNFKQHFARGQSFTYALDDVGRYYADYVDLMAHVDRVLPGRVHRVIYERMVDDSEAEIRALLAALGLPFEAACLSFHENERAVRTASSEQVRQPINRSGVDQWLPFDPWLGPLKDALGEALTAYPDAPLRPAS